MNADHTEVKVAVIPDCNICAYSPIQSTSVPAVYDGKTNLGPWAYMCEEHFRTHGIGLGLGKGQKLVLENKTGDQ